MKKPWICPKCRREFAYDQPTIIDGCIGNATAKHDCGPGFVAVRLRPASKDAKAFWNAVKEKLL